MSQMFVARAIMVLVGLAGLMKTSEAAKLLLMPASVNSHVNYFCRLGMALAQEGHDVTALIPSVSKVPDWFRHDHIEVMTYKVPGSVPYTNSPRASEMMVKQALTESLFEKLGIIDTFGKEVLEAWADECDALLSDLDLRKTLADRKYDHAIYDTAHTGCQVVLPYSLDIPFSGLSILSFPWLFRVPALPSFYPNLLSDFTDVMTFWERVQNVLGEIALITMFNKPDLKQNIRRYAPDKPDIDRLELVPKIKLWFVLYDVTTGYPAPLMPNVIPVGDMLAVPSKPLQEDFLGYLDSAPKGVVLVSFGTVVEHLPEVVIRKLCASFRQIPFKVIWKLNKPELCYSENENIRILSWLPQNDLLGHPKVKLFITHAGISSTVETIYHGVPVITFPFGIDQQANAAFLSSRGYGVRMSIRDFTQKQLADNIVKVIEDTDFTKRIKKASVILKEKPDTPGSRASFWIDHVIKHGDETLKTGAFQLNMFQFYMVDVFLFLLLCLFVLIAFIVIVLYCFCKICTKVFCKTYVKEKLP